MRCFVTGLGAVCCAGHGVAALQAALADGQSGIAPAGADRPDLPAHAALGLVREVPYDAVPRVDAFLAAAMAEALMQAQVERLARLPVYLGSAHGNLDLWRRGYQAGAPRADGLWNPAHDFLRRCAGETDLTVVSTACTASAVAFGLALDALRGGECEICVVAGAESITPFLYHGFDSLRSLAPENCRPFDRARNGLVLGEGAAALVLESEAHAARRGARVLAEAAGYGFAADGMHLTAPDPAGGGAAAALRKALDDARLDEAPGFINLHGTGTVLNDRMECTALRRVFGRSASGIPLTATKPVTGHLCGAAGAIELVGSVIGLQTGTAAPILGFDAPDPEFAHFDFVRGGARRGAFRSAVSMNSGFGGTNSAIVLRRAGA
jgi:3-oxoacyl-[acyl-carrier-protein] synthase II